MTAPFLPRSGPGVDVATAASGRAASMAQMAAFAAGLDEKQSLESYDAYAGAAVSANDYTSSHGAPVLDFTSSSGSGAPPPAPRPCARPREAARECPAAGLYL